MVRNSQRKNYDVFLFASISTIRTFHDSTMLHKLEYARNLGLCCTYY